MPEHSDCTARLGTLQLGDLPVLNSSCPWASTRAHLQALFDCKYTGGVVTRTATQSGFPDDPRVHRHAFFQPDESKDDEGTSSINTYGYSPRPLADYLDDVKAILAISPHSIKPFIISITGGKEELHEMLHSVQGVRQSLGAQGSRIGVELNSSCPNIPGKPPPAYDMVELAEYLEVVSRCVEGDPSLTVGLKLPPYTYSQQFSGIVDVLEAATNKCSRQVCPIAYLACTNTLGSCWVGEDQMVPGGAQTPLVGGVGGDAIHALSVGNVFGLSRALQERAGRTPALAQVRIVGIGGVRSAAGARRMRRAGASVVACATAFGRLGNGVFEDLARGMREGYDG